MKFFYWDPKDDPREPEYWETRNGSPFLSENMNYSKY